MLFCARDDFLLSKAFREIRNWRHCVSEKYKKTLIQYRKFSCACGDFYFFFLSTGCCFFGFFCRGNCRFTRRKNGDFSTWSTKNLKQCLCIEKIFLHGNGKLLLAHTIVLCVFSYRKSESKSHACECVTYGWV